MKKFSLFVLLGAFLAATAALAKLSYILSVGKDGYQMHHLDAQAAGVGALWPVYGRILNLRGRFYIPFCPVLVNHLPAA